jgi:NADPH-dependent 2,4-dienoyl-CoA reductase/sulfur reductase-like enzyme/rhodanese-related sulfurtransferase
MRTVIIGGVAGGMSAATRLRRLREDAEIIVLEQGRHVSYASCGLPYHVGGVIPAEDSLLLQTPASLAARFRLDVRTGHRVTRIRPQERVVEVLRLATGETLVQPYDHLIIATGARPRVLELPGLERALVLRDVEDAVRIKALVDQGGIGSAAVLGAGFIGVELAENLQRRGVRTTLVELGGSILPQLDVEVVEPFQAHLVAHGLELVLGAQVQRADASSLHLQDGRSIPAELLVSAVGVVAESRLAADAGLRLGASGGIWVDEQQRTSDPHIFAVGDVAQKTSLLTGEPQMIWLANLANRHGRLVADVIAGHDVVARPSLGTGIIGAFGMVAALTGLTEGMARRLGVAHQVVHVHPGSHAGYYPGASPIALKMLFAPQGGRLLGAQAVGLQGVDKRIDVAATAIYAGLGIDDLINLELAYAPEFGSAKDAINQAGYVGNNVLHGQSATLQWHELAEAQEQGARVVDVRSASERAAGSIPGTVHIPVDELRERYVELVGKQVVVHCAVGQRGHVAARLLRAHGIAVRNLDGGYKTWLAGTTARERLALA